MWRLKKRSKWEVKFDPYQPLYFVVYVDGSDSASYKVAELKRVLLPYGVEVKVKPITANSPTRIPAIFVQDKYYFTLLSQFNPSEVISFVMQVRSKVEKMGREFVNRNRGKFVVMLRPLFDKDSHEYVDRFHLLSPSMVNVGFMSFDTNRVGFPATRWLVESLKDMGVDVLVYPSSHTISEFRFFVGRLSTGED